MERDGQTPEGPKGAELHKRSETKRGSERGCLARGLGQDHIKKAALNKRVVDKVAMNGPPPHRMPLLRAAVP